MTHQMFCGNYCCLGFFSGCLWVHHLWMVSCLSVTVVCVSPVPMMVPKTTAETLKHKINPSLELAAPQAVDVLLYTPGTNTHTNTHISPVTKQVPSVFILSLRWLRWVEVSGFYLSFSQGSFTIQSFNCDTGTLTIYTDWQIHTQPLPLLCPC